MMSPKEYDRAITDHDQSIRLDPKYDKVFASRAFAYASRREYSRAIITTRRFGLTRVRGFASENADFEIF